MFAALLRGVLWTYIAFMTFGAVMALLALIVALYIAQSYTPLRRLRLGDRVGLDQKLVGVEGAQPIRQIMI